jgi:competence protein ComEC
MLRQKNQHWYLLCIAYIIGLLGTGIPLHHLQLNYLGQSVIFCGSVIILNLIALVIIPPFFHGRIPRSWWLISTLVIIISYYYYQWRLPTPSPRDISHQLTEINQPWANNITITGKILSPPKINYSHRAKFELQILTLQESEKPSTEVTGKVYVTAPLLMTTGLYPTQTISLRGKLYQPSPQLNPGGFDFSNYLALRGIFTGFTANQLEILAEGNPLAQFRWQLRQRVIKTHVRYLHTEKGTLVSSIALGNRVVDLPYHLLSSFRQIGLAHVISASGFHVSLLLTAILLVTQAYSPQIRLIFGLTGLLFYLILTGFYPSVLRASLMGVAVLIGIISTRRVKVSASLWLVATILLIINPLWIWDLGFQFSFLATWGLIANLEAIVKGLAWLPPTIANLIAVPLVATIWTLPLQGYIFHGFSPYCLVTNILTTPLVIVLSLGGMITGLIGIFSPLIGSYFTILLMPFSGGLIKLVEKMSNLPFSWLAVGKFPLVLILICYGFLFLLTVSVWWQKRWFKSSFFLVVLIIITLVYQKLNLVQITVMATSSQPTIVIQNNHQTGVINLNDKNIINFSLLPFLNSQGINQLTFVYDFSQLNNKLNINYLSSLLKIKQIINYQNIKQLFSNQELKLKTFNSSSEILQLDFNNLYWLIINTNKIVKLPHDLHTDILIYSGSNLSLAQLEQLNAKIAIAFSSYFSSQHQEYFKQNQVTMFATQKDGAIQWQPKTGFIAYGTDYDKI